MNGYDESLTCLLNKNLNLFIIKIFFEICQYNQIKKETKIILEKFMKSNPQPLTNTIKSKNEINGLISFFNKEIIFKQK